MPKVKITDRKEHMEPSLFPKIMGKPTYPTGDVLMFLADWGVSQGQISNYVTAKFLAPYQRTQRTARFFGITEIYKLAFLLWLTQTGYDIRAVAGMFKRTHWGMVEGDMISWNGLEVDDYLLVESRCVNGKIIRVCHVLKEKELKRKKTEITESFALYGGEIPIGYIKHFVDGEIKRHGYR